MQVSVEYWIEIEKQEWKMKNRCLKTLVSSYQSNLWNNRTENEEFEVAE
jgi:hypothetical protein